MRRGFAAVLVGIVFMANLSCSVNILSTFANKTSNEALFEDAQLDVNSGNYNAALTKISSMTGDYPTSPAVVQLEASAYAGLCGFQFFPFVTAMGNMGATRLFPFLLANFDAAAATNIDNCVAAQNLMESIGTVNQRSSDQNLFLALISFAKMGNILSYYADATKTGAAAAGFNPCTIGAGPPRPAAGSNISDADAREFGVALALAISNLTAVAGTVNLGSGSLSSLNGVCAALPNNFNFCGVTDPAALTTNELKGIRSFINESTVIGLGSNCAGDVTTCVCP